MPRKTNKGRRRPYPGKIRTLPSFGRMSLTRGQESMLDGIWSVAVKARAGDRCEMCLKSGVRLESHHFYGRRKKSIRHIVSNGFSLCHPHHRHAEEQPANFVQWAIRSRGKKWFDDLEILSRETKVHKEFTVIKAYLESFI